MKKTVISASTLLAIAAAVVAIMVIKMPDVGNSTNGATSNAVSTSAVEVANVTNRTYHKVTKASDVTSNKTTNPNSNVSTMPARGEITIQVPSTTVASTNKVTYANNGASAIATRPNTTTTKRATTTTTKRATTTQRVATTQKATTTKRPATTAVQRSISLDTVPETTKRGGNTGRVVGYENEMLKTLNGYRTKAGIAPVQMTETLNNLASVRAKELSVYYNDKHIRPNGSDWYTVLDNNGVSFVTAGENIAYGQPNCTSIMTAWYNSSGHRKNMLNSQYKYAGFGCYSNNGTNYWVQIFIG